MRLEAIEAHMKVAYRGYVINILGPLLKLKHDLEFKYKADDDVIAEQLIDYVEGLTVLLGASDDMIQEAIYKAFMGEYDYYFELPELYNEFKQKLGDENWYNEKTAR